MPPKAQKSVILMLTNVGSTSLSLNSLEDEPFLDKAKYAMKIIVEKKIFLQPKDEIGILTMGDETDNPYDIDYVKIYQEHLLVPNWDMVKYIDNLEANNKPCNWIEGLHASLDYIKQEVLDPAFNVFLVIFNNFQESAESIMNYNSNTIANELQNYNIRLLFVGEKSYEDLTASPTPSEQFILDFIDKLEGLQKPQYEQLNTFIECRRFYTAPSVNSLAWKFDLEWNELCIPCAEFVKTTDDSKLESWKLCGTESDNPSNSINTDSLLETDNVRVVKKNVVFDPDRNKVSEEDIIQGYKFGGKYISCNEEDEKAMRYGGSEKGMIVYGFVPQDKIKLEYWSGNGSRIVIPASPDESEAFYTLVQAMVESKVVAIIRKVHANNNLPKMGALFPKVDDDDIWCLVHIEIPFADDVRFINKRPIKSIETIVSKEKLDAIDNFIDSMTVTDNEIDYLNPGMFPNVQRQYYWNAIADRALNPDGPLLPLNDYIKQYLKPPEFLQMKAKSSIQKLDELFQDCKKIEDEKSKAMEVDMSQKNRNENDVSVPVDNISVSNGDTSKKEFSLKTEDVKSENLEDF